MWNFVLETTQCGLQHPVGPTARPAPNCLMLETTQRGLQHPVGRTARPAPNCLSQTHLVVAQAAMLGANVFKKA